LSALPTTVGASIAPNRLAMKIQVNGEMRELRTSRTVAELVSELELLPAAVLVEHNGTALHRSEWPETSLAEGDSVEFLRVVAGG
jgi:sulfur carrier protein